MTHFLQTGPLVPGTLHANNLRLRVKMSAGASPTEKPLFAMRKEAEEEGSAA